MKTFDSNRPLEILIIHSELVCQNDAIQKYTTLVKVPSRFNKFRFEKLYRMAGWLFPARQIIKDYEWFEEYQN